MNPETILAAVQAGLSVAAQVATLISEIKTAVDSNDPAALDAALAKIQAANDALGTQA